MPQSRGKEGEVEKQEPTTVEDALTSAIIRIANRIGHHPMHEDDLEDAQAVAHLVGSLATVVNMPELSK